MRLIGWTFILGGVVAIIYGLNRELFAIMAGGSGANHAPDIPFERVLFSILGGLFVVAGCVLASAGSIVAAVRTGPPRMATPETFTASADEFLSALPDTIDQPKT